jgi:hypothetical protein
MCTSDATLNGRPNVGRGAINKAYFTGNFVNDKASWIKTIIHEVNHALGFSNDVFGRYVKPDGTLWGASNVVGTDS